MKAFITGATGFVGRNFLAWMLANRPDWELTCLVRDESRARGQWPDARAGRVCWLAGDLLAPETYADRLRQADYVFHIAALVSLRDGPEFYTMNTDTTRRLVETLSAGGRLKRLVFVSSISAIDRPPGPHAVGPLTEASPPHPNTDYGRSKLQAEECVAASGLPYSMLRPSYIYGPYPRLKSSMDRLIFDVLNQRHYTRFPFPGRVSEIYAGDLAECIELAAHHPDVENRAFFVANREPVRIREVYPRVARELGVPWQPMDVPEERVDRYRRLLYRRFPHNLMLRILFEDYFYCSVDQWYNVTGYQPTVGYEEGVCRTVRWYREHGMLPEKPPARNISS